MLFGSIGQSLKKEYSHDEHINKIKQAFFNINNDQNGNFL